jgi:hypothetical protein
MNQLLVGYARVSTEHQDLTAQRDSLAALGVGDDRIYVCSRSASEIGPFFRRVHVVALVDVARHTFLRRHAGPRV